MRFIHVFLISTNTYQLHSINHEILFTFVAELTLMSYLSQLKHSFLFEEKIDAIHPDLILPLFCTIGLKIQLTHFEMILFLTKFAAMIGDNYKQAAIAQND